MDLQERACAVRRLENCEMWLWRKVLNITWSDKVCNKEVLRRACEVRAIIPVINRRQRVLLGHTLRHDDLVPLVIEGRIIGKRPPGRPRVGMLDRAKDGSPYVSSGQEARLRSIRKDLPVGRTHTHTHTHTQASPCYKPTQYSLRYCISPGPTTFRNLTGNKRCGL